MSLYTINPLETAPIPHSEYCFARKRISHSAQTLLPISLLKRPRISQRTVRDDLVGGDHNEEPARSCLRLELCGRTGKQGVKMAEKDWLIGNLLAEAYARIIEAMAQVV